jgi:XTP/dITP diphosphohydrolase
MTDRVVLASNNAGKVREFRHLLAGLGVQIVPQSELGVPEAEESGLSFVENAIIKARNAARITGLPALADDSGLEVDYLDGAPGIYSSRFAGPDADDHANNARLLALLEDAPEARRTARFQCLLVYMRHHSDPTPIICQGTWEGIIGHDPAGDQGFGYDPLFYLPDRQCTAAQLPRETKNTISHRARAMAQLAARLDAPHR